MRRYRRVRLPGEASWPRIVDPLEGVEVAVPPFATRADALARAALARAGAVHLVRFFPDWGHPWPLWDTRCGYTAEPDDYGLGEELSRWMRTWYGDWARCFSDVEVWRGAPSYATWADEGDRIAADLAVEIWRIGDVTAQHRMHPAPRQVA